MFSEVMKYIIVYLISMFKFVGGPAFGAAYNLNLVITACMTILGMMTSVIVISFYGQKLRKLIRAKYGSRQKLFTRRNRRIIKIWRGYGEFGVSFFTPVFFHRLLVPCWSLPLAGKENAFSRIC